MGYLKKEDIKESGLLKTACGNYYEFRRRFAEKRFKFLTEWDPNFINPMPTTLRQIWFDSTSLCCNGYIYSRISDCI